METYRIHISKDNLVFAAAHFVTFDGDQCEPLHGHNYRLSATVEGALDENSYVVNFVPLKRLLKRLADELDHRMLLPLQSRVIAVREEGDSVVAEAQGRRYVFPRGDVVLLPIANTTAELLARHIGRRLLDELRAWGATNVTAVEVEVQETFGQGGLCRLTSDELRVTSAE
jgi:6-pyruvoyltetrahydropterin/6-carboxytetrahydropterin synthase